MGEQSISTFTTQEKRADFIQHLLNDIEALEQMLANGLIEQGITRIGAEQEFCLLNENWRPASANLELLDHLQDPHFTTELARYNLEINLDPFTLKGGCFSQMEKQLRKLLNMAEQEAHKKKIKVLLTGILPSISKYELEPEFMTPLPRYQALNNLMLEMRGSDFSLHIRGVDELSIVHDSVLFEACNTSFQTHLQIDPDDFVKAYNWAQAIAAPVMAIAANSPLLLGRELWHETRIALFQQSIDTRTSSLSLKDQLPRVGFGQQWASGTIADIFKDDIARHKIILSREIENNALQELKEGTTPKLKALSLHNSTIYRWNRPCYGTTNEKPHVRIEARYLPAGPTIQDEMANFAFWVGLMLGRPQEYDKLPELMDFREVKDNFIRAARTGKSSILSWKGELISVRDLLQETLLPLAYKGLQEAGIDKADIERLLGIIEARTAGQTGAQWCIRNYRKLRQQVKEDDALLSLTKVMYEKQQTDKAVHDWPDIASQPAVHRAADHIGHIMSTQLFTVNDNDLASLATSIMRWKNIHHVPVENSKKQLCGLLTWTHMKRFRERVGIADDQRPVSEIMTRAVITVQPATPIQDAIRLMKRNEIGCLPVVVGQELVGIITIKDVLPFDHGQGIQ